MKLAVIGGGSWGTTLANMYAKKGIDTTLWVREQDLITEIRKTGENTWYLPGFKLDERMKVNSQLEKVISSAECFLFCVPCQFFRSVLEDVKKRLPSKPVIICANKGIEVENLATMSQVVKETLADKKPSFAMLSGPSFAREVIKEMPTAVALGCADKKLGIKLQSLLSTDYFRVYTSPDVRGVELGGAVKNIVAICAGIVDGLGYGSNSRAALITRGLAEMSRLGKAMGGDSKTFMGLAGMGDLVLTCTGELSRNRQVGLRLGRGNKLVEILSEMRMVAEGVKTTEAVHALGKQLKVELPITEQLYQVLYQDKDAKQALNELMQRPLKEE